METPNLVSTTGFGKNNRSSIVAPSIEVIEPKNEVFETPTRRITRSISNNSDSMAAAPRSPDSHHLQNSVAIKKSPELKSSKRQIELVVLDPSSKKKKSVQSNAPKEGEYYVHPGNRFGASVNVFYRYEVITNLKLNLNAHQKQIFTASCFGHFLGMSDIRLQNQLIHKMLLLEVRQSSHEEMWFNIVGRVIKFSIEEFSLISGLKCDGDDNTNKYKIGTCCLNETFFSNLKSVSRKDVERVFLRPPQNTSDEDVVKLGILYLISSFLFTSPQPKLVSKETMRLVDSPDMGSFPWGKELFNMTYFSLKMALARSNPNFGETRGTMSYKLHGFPLAFQIWIYEYIPILCGKVCTRVGNVFPRVVNWSSDDTRVTGASLDKILFENDEVVVVSFQPSEEEMQSVYFHSLSQKIHPKNKKSVSTDFLNDPLHSAKDHSTPGTSIDGFLRCSNRRRGANSNISEGTIVSLFEDLLNKVHDIRVQQDQIMDFQVDLQTDILQMQRFNTTRHEMFMEEFRLKFPGSGHAKCARSEHHNNGDMSPIIKSTVSGCTKMTTKSSARATHTELGSTVQESSKIGLACSDPGPLTGNGKLPVTTVLVNSANKLKGEALFQKNTSCCTEYQGTDHITHAVNATTHNQLTPSPVLQERTVSKFNAMQSIESGEITAKSRYSIYALSEGLAAPPPEVVATFDKWIRDGYRPIKIRTKFPASKDTIQPPYKFGPIEVNTKTWWYELWERNVNLRDSVNSSNTLSRPFPQTAYIACKDDLEGISNCRFIVEYVNGEYLHCNRKWTEIGHVLIPIMMEKKAHWILAHFDIKERTLHVYNSSRLTIRDRIVIADVEAFAYVLPMLMINTGEWQLSTTVGLVRVEPLLVKIVNDIPQDEFGNDSGVFVIKYAEHILNGRIHDMKMIFDPNEARTNLSCQLFKYGNEKRCGGYETDCDLVPRSVRKPRKGKMIEN